MEFVQSFIVAQNPLLVPAAAHSGECLGAAAAVALATAVAEAAVVAMVAKVAGAAAMAVAACTLVPTGNHYNCTGQ